MYALRRGESCSVRWDWVVNDEARPCESDVESKKRNMRLYRWIETRGTWR
jgi:hypothetical protein